MSDYKDSLSIISKIEGNISKDKNIAKVYNLSKDEISKANP